MTEEHLASLMVEYRGALLRYLRARGAGDEAEDLVQEVWLRLAAADLRAIADERAYLYRAAHNLMLDRARERRRRAAREQVFHDLHGDDADRSRRLDTEQALIARERLIRVDAALRGLGPRTDAIFRRYRIERVPQRALAAEFGISLSAVEKHLQKAYRAVAAAQQDEDQPNTPAPEARDDRR